MNIREKIFYRMALASALLFAVNGTAHAQMDLTLDTLNCHIVGFNIGTKMPSATASFGTAPDGSTSQAATMSSLYKSPYLNFGINTLYKFKSNWLVTLDADLWFGNDNLLHRENRLGSIFTHDSNNFIIGTGGTDAGVSCYNRGLSIQGGVGKIFTVAPTKNPNSGILVHACGGYMRQQTIFMQSLEAAPQISGDYAYLYDHQRHGLMLTEGIGYWFMSNHSNLINLYVVFDVSQCWSHSTREYIIDNYLGLRGKDNNHYFDLLYTVKLCWMFPLKGKPSHDYYFY